MCEEPENLVLVYSRRIDTKIDRDNLRRAGPAAGDACADVCGGAHWNEMIADPETRIFRPRQLYTGPSAQHTKPLVG
jgi:hypothetical protein